MTETTVQAATSLVDRRSYGTAVPPLVERRQFGNSYEELSAPRASWLRRSTNTNCGIVDASSAMRRCSR